MQMGLYSSRLTEYIQLKYEIPKNISIIFSFHSNRLYCEDMAVPILLDTEDIPEEWIAAIPIAQKMFIKDKKTPVTFTIPIFGQVLFWGG